MKVKDILEHSWCGGVQKGICDHENKRMNSQIKVTDKNC